MNLEDKFKDISNLVSNTPRAIMVENVIIREESDSFSVMDEEDLSDN